LLTEQAALNRVPATPAISSPALGFRRCLLLLTGRLDKGPGGRLRELRVPLGEQVMVAPDARMDAALGTLQDGEAGPVLVAQAGRW
jgi:hypothetical protein